MGRMEDDVKKLGITVVAVALFGSMAFAGEPAPIAAPEPNVASPSAKTELKTQSPAAKTESPPVPEAKTETPPAAAPATTVAVVKPPEAAAKPAASGVTEPPCDDTIFYCPVP